MSTDGDDRLIEFIDELNKKSELVINTYRCCASMKELYIHLLKKNKNFALNNYEIESVLAMINLDDKQ